METEDLQWRTQLKDDLMLLAEQFTPDRYPANEETQRTYDYSLFVLEESYAGKLDSLFRGRRIEFDTQYRERLLEPLDAAEREVQRTAKTHEDLWAFRAGQSGDRRAIDEGRYRQDEVYKTGIQRLADERAEWTDQMDLALRQVTNTLDERFGLDRDRDQERSYER